MAVYSLWHFPSGRLAASPPASIPCGLRGIAPFGVRTFLPPGSLQESDPPPFQNQSYYIPIRSKRNLLFPSQIQVLQAISFNVLTFQHFNDSVYLPV